jgi:hypothetical protein
VYSVEYYDASGMLSERTTYQTGTPITATREMYCYLNEYTVKNTYASPMVDRDDTVILRTMDDSGRVGVEAEWTFGKGGETRLHSYASRQENIKVRGQRKVNITRYLNTKKQVTTERIEDLAGNLVRKLQYTYDGRGSVLTELHIGPDGKGIMKYVWKYTYGPDGYWLTRIEQRVYYADGRSVTWNAHKDTREVKTDDSDSDGGTGPGDYEPSTIASADRELRECVDSGLLLVR